MLLGIHNTLFQLKDKKFLILLNINFFEYKNNNKPPKIIIDNKEKRKKSNNFGSFFEVIKLQSFIIINSLRIKSISINDNIILYKFLFSRLNISLSGIGFDVTELIDIFKVLDCDSSFIFLMLI